MICVKFTAFCDLRADLRIRLATHRKSVCKFWFCKLVLTCVDLRRLASPFGQGFMASVVIRVTILLSMFAQLWLYSMEKQCMAL